LTSPRAIPRSVFTARFSLIIRTGILRTRKHGKSRLVFEFSHPATSQGIKLQGFWGVIPRPTTRIPAGGSLFLFCKGFLAGGTPHPMSIPAKERTNQGLSCSRALTVTNQTAPGEPRLLSSFQLTFKSIRQLFGNNDEQRHAVVNKVAFCF